MGYEQHIVCDQCGERKATSSPTVVPFGWVTLHEVGNSAGEVRDTFCSLGCAAKFIDEKLEATR